jgi:hypothetical protein
MELEVIAAVGGEGKEDGEWETQWQRDGWATEIEKWDV